MVDIAVFTAIVFFITVVVIFSCICGIPRMDKSAAVCCAFITGCVSIVVPVLYIVALRDVYIPSAEYTNNQIQLSASTCYVYKISTYAKTYCSIRYKVEYINVYDNITGAYYDTCDAACDESKKCDIISGTNITCYPYGNTYILIPYFEDVGLLERYLVWGYIQLCLFGILGCGSLLICICHICDLHKR